MYSAPYIRKGLPWRGALSAPAYRCNNPAGDAAVPAAERISSAVKYIQCGCPIRCVFPQAADHSETSLSCASYAGIPHNARSAAPGSAADHPDSGFPQYPLRCFPPSSYTERTPHAPYTIQIQFPLADGFPYRSAPDNACCPFL